MENVSKQSILSDFVGITGIVESEIPMTNQS